MIDLTPVFEALILLIAAILTWKVIPWIRQRTTQEQQNALSAVVRTLVFAAEQVFGSGFGEEKLDWVIQRLRDKGYTVDTDMIEATVMECLNLGRKEEEQAGPVPDLNISNWDADQLEAFCESNGIPHDGCGTKEMLLEAIEAYFSQAASLKEQA